MVSSSPSDMSEKHMLENVLDIPQRNETEQLLTAPNNIPNGDHDPQQFHLEYLSKKRTLATPSGNTQVGRSPRSTGHARFRRPFACKNTEEALNGPNPNLQLNKNGGCYSDSLKRCNVEMGLADQNIAAKRLQDQNFRQIINGGTSSSNPTNVVDTQISNNAGKNLNTPALGLAMDQTVGGTPNPDALKVQQLSSTDAATTLKDLQLLNVGTPAPNFISNNVSGTQTAPNASTQPGVIIRDNASKGKRVHEEYKGWFSCPTTNANLESLLKRHREMYSISNSDMQRLLSKFSGPKTNQAPVVTGFDDSNQSLFHKPMAQCAMGSSSLIPRALANLDMNLGGQSFLPSQASGFSGWVNPITPMMTYADLQRRLGVMNPMGPFLMPEEPKSPSELAVGPSSSNQMENVEGRNAEQAQEDEVNGDEELDLDLKL